MRDAVIVSTARTGIGKAYRGRVQRDPFPDPRRAPDPRRNRARQGRSGRGRRRDHGRRASAGRADALSAAPPRFAPAAGDRCRMSIDRQCASGLMAIATGAKQIIVDRMDVIVAGGVESISLVQTGEMRLGPDPELLSMHNGVYMPMIDTAEVVGKRYDISRERCDEYALRSQQRTAEAQRSGRFDDEIIAVTATMAVKDKATGEVSMREVTLDRDEGNRPETTLEGLAKPRAGARTRKDHHRRQCQPAQRRRFGLRHHER